MDPSSECQSSPKSDLLLTTETAKQAVSAMERTLAITELRENIISHLPPKDVLLAQRVSKTWQATIKGSLMLQRALGFVPNGSTDTSSSGLHVDFDSIKSTSHSEGLTAVQFFEASQQAGAITINPLLYALCKAASHNCFEPPKAELRTVLKDTESSWNKILLTQPPIRRATVRCLCQGVRDVGMEERVERGLPYIKEGRLDGVEEDKGLTVRDLLKCLGGFDSKSSPLEVFCLKV